MDEQPEAISAELLEKIGQKRIITIALEGSEHAKRLAYQSADASAIGDHIYLKPNPLRIAVLEEFFHGTQARLGMDRRYGIFELEVHVKQFMLRHKSRLGLTSAEMRRLNELLDDAVDRLRRSQL